MVDLDMQPSVGCAFHHLLNPGQADQALQPGLVVPQRSSVRVSIA